MDAPNPQLDFGHARAQADGPRPRGLPARRREHAHTLARVIDATGSDRVLRDAAIDQVKVALAEFVERVGVLKTFQCADVTRWIDAAGSRPDPRVLDLRVLGGLIKAMERRGILRQVGYQPTGAGSYHSCVRPVYLVVGLDFTKLDWPCLKGAAA